MTETRCVPHRNTPWTIDSRHHEAQHEAEGPWSPARVPGTIACVDKVTDLRTSQHWRQAVWGLRVMGPGLAVVLAGLVALLWSTGAGETILAVGMGIYLVGVVITVVGIVVVYRRVRPVRPNLIELRWSLLYDAVHARPATAAQLAVGADPLGDRHTEASRVEEAEKLRRSPHWRLAVWGVRAIGPGLAVAVAGLIALLWSTATATAILAVGLGIYFVGLIFSFLEVHWAYGDVKPLHPNYARARRTLFHDALHARQ
jgi:hypothetical protein